jgi:hypothetical protein
VLIDELGDAVTALARAARALDPRYVQLASDIAECEIGVEPWARVLQRYR